MKNKQQYIFDDYDDTELWEKEWNNMPEYNNQKNGDPAITVTFKFKTEEDYLAFKSLIKKHLYKGEKPFNGMQRKEAKNAWYPHKEKASKYGYI